MNVWVVECGVYSDRGIWGIFATKDDAEKASAWYTGGPVGWAPHSAEIWEPEEWDVDTYETFREDHLKRYGSAQSYPQGEFVVSALVSADGPRWISRSWDGGVPDPRGAWEGAVGVYAGSDLPSCWVHGVGQTPDRAEKAFYDHVAMVQARLRGIA
jgi:hypothetical protein